jgi:hypothetical protein
MPKPLGAGEIGAVAENPKTCESLPPAALTPPPAELWAGVSPSKRRHIQVHLIDVEGSAAASEQVVRRIVEIAQVTDIRETAILPSGIRWLCRRSVLSIR